MSSGADHAAAGKLAAWAAMASQTRNVMAALAALAFAAQIAEEAFIAAAPSHAVRRPMASAGTN